MAWPMRHLVARVEPDVDAVLAEHATSYWGRPLARRVVEPSDRKPAHQLLWTIDGEPVAELLLAERGPVTLVVHDFSVFTELRTAIRSRRVHVRLATHLDSVDGA